MMDRRGSGRPPLKGGSWLSASVLACSVLCGSPVWGQQDVGTQPIVAGAARAVEEPRSYRDSRGLAFYYGGAPPEELLKAAGEVVVQPDRLPANIEGSVLASTASPGVTGRERASLCAYLSLGEVAKTEAQAQLLAEAWKIGENGAWGSWIVDPAQAAYQEFVLRRYEELWSRGYRSFFLDTLDSYQMPKRGSSQREASRRGLVTLIREMARRHPEARLTVNRGFELLQEIGSVVHGLVAESLFDGWDAARGQYVRVSPSDREWLSAKLAAARDHHKLTVTVVDYRPASERAEARETAARIAALGFRPWVADHDLITLGVGEREVLPRRVLVVTNEANETADEGVVGPLRPVLQYLGYTVATWNARASLPPRDDASLAGVVTWLSSSVVAQGYGDWVAHQIATERRVAILGAPGFAWDGPLAKELGLQLIGSAALGPTHVSKSDAMVGFESPPPARPLESPLYRYEGAQGTVHLELADGTGRVGVAALTAPWGGLASSHVVALAGLAGERRWVLDPFRFLKTALSLPEVPAFDVTTQGGRRLAVFLVREQGLSWPAPSGRSAAQELQTELWEKYAWPHSLERAQDFGGNAPDRAAARTVPALAPLTRATSVEAGPLLDAERPSFTRARAARCQSGRLLAPVGGDAAFIGTSEIPYAFARVRESLQHLGEPRRLGPIFVDYHGYLGSSSGGRQALREIYAWAAEQRPFVMTADEYCEQLEGFEDGTLVRRLDGSIEVLSSSPAVTLRVPKSMGTPSPLGSSALTTLTDAGDEYFVSLGDGARRVLRFGAASDETPHVEYTSGVLSGFTASGTEVGGSRYEWTFQWPGRQRSLEVGLADAPWPGTCTLRSGSVRLEQETPGSGRVEFRVNKLQTGLVRLSCAADRSGPVAVSERREQ